MPRSRWAFPSPTVTDITAMITPSTMVWISSDECPPQAVVLHREHGAAILPDMIDHISISVSDIARSKAFYTAALAPLGITVLRDFGQVLGLGKDQKPDFWIAGGEANAAAPGRVHVAFVAADRAEVEAFYKAAMAAGGKDNGPPGTRAQYHPGYFGAFVLDPDGHNVEAVCHRPV